MYKRRARLLFVHPLDREKARTAAEIATQLGQDWLESRDTCYADYIGNVDPTGNREWADLVILLGAMPADALPLAPHAQLRCWQMTEDANWLDRLSHKIQGVIGGLRLLARLDAGDNTLVEDPDQK